MNPLARVVSTQAVVATLIAENRQSIPSIAKTAGISEHVVRRWIDTPAFQEIVASARAKLLDKIWDAGIARKEGRIAAYQDRWNRLNDLIIERADAFKDVVDEENMPIPGGRGRTSGPPSS